MLPPGGSSSPRVAASRPPFLPPPTLFFVHPPSRRPFEVVARPGCAGCHPTYPQVDPAERIGAAPGGPSPLDPSLPSVRPSVRTVDRVPLGRLVPLFFILITMLMVVSINNNIDNSNNYYYVIHYYCCYYWYYAFIIVSRAGPDSLRAEKLLMSG